MNNAEFQLQWLGDPRLAVHATSPQPAWLWSIDGTRILWANPVGAKLFGAGNGVSLAKGSFGPADQHRRQVARLAGGLPPNGGIRLERLRGFGAAPGMLATCACSRLDFPDGSHGILITAAGIAAGRIMPLFERLQRLVEGVDMPIAAFARDGMFIGASDAARPLLAFRNLSEAGLDEARDGALKQGRVETPVGIGHVVLQRVGSGTDIGLVALVEPGATAAAHIHHVAPLSPEAAPEQPPAVQPAPDYEAPAQSGEAPAEFALFDEFAEPPAAPVIADVAADPESPVEPEAPAASEPALFEVVPDSECPQHEPSPCVEAVAGELTPASSEESPPQAVADQAAPAPPVEASALAVASKPVESPSWLEEPVPNTRRLPLRFMWQMDHEGRFSLGSDEFTRLIGTRTAASFGRLWSEIAETFGLDREGRIMKAFATHDTWSGVVLNWPVDGGGRLPIELSGLPIFDPNGNFAGYRGFGVCRDLDGLARLAAFRRYEFFGGPPVPQSQSADVRQAGPAEGGHAEALVQQEALVQRNDLLREHSSQGYLFQEHLPEEPSSTADLPAGSSVASPAPTELPEPIASETSQQADLETTVETPTELPKDLSEDLSEDPSEDLSAQAPKNVVPFRPAGETKPPSLTPVENNAFNELARQLSARLENETGMLALSASSDAGDTVIGPAASDEPEPAREAPAGDQPANEKLGWLVEPEPAPRGEARRDKALLDLLPIGVLIYRLDRLLYANRAFLERMGYDGLRALEDAGGLDALYVEPGVSNASSTSGTGTPVKISANRPAAEDADHRAADARLYTISWDDESALALIFSETRGEGAAVAAALAQPAPPPEPSPAGYADAEELGAILDTAVEGIVMFDAEGNINSCNRSAEALFGYDGEEFVRHNLVDLFAPESRHAVFDYLASIKGAGIESLLDHGREALGRVRQGGLVPLSITMGRTRAGGPNFFAVFRDLSQAKKGENELREARRLAERAGTAKADMLARISHEVRTPLNAIIGFAEVMIGERFGALGNERYVEYMKDIRASGERVLSIINDLLDLSRIETGKLDLAFTHQSLNEMVESCVAVMQPQANRERIIIRTSLAHALPPIVADARALRQITLNLIGNSIHLANAGGQVIVSTALSDFGDVMLRVRDTGHGLNDREVAAALEPFRTPSDQASDGPAVSLSLTKALVEANRAKFHIKTGARSGTLIEVVFSHATAHA